MRILQLCNKAPYPPNDGSSIAICNLTEGLTEQNIELHLLCINTKKHFKPDENIPFSFIQKTHYKSVFKNTSANFLKAFLNLFSSQSYFVSRFFFKEFELELIKKLQSNIFDIVQLEGVFMASYVPVIKQYSKAKIILRAHNVEHQIWERALLQEKNWFKKIYLTIQKNRLKKFELNTFNKVDAIVSITDEDKKNISSIFPQKIIHTCLTGINLKSYNPISIAKEPNTLFYFASMDWIPNVEALDWFLQNVWGNILEKLPQTKLIIAGKGMQTRFKNLASKNITIIEHVESSKVFYDTYDIMLVPLFSGSGLRIKLVEGLAYGKPIITTSIGAEGIPYTKDVDMLIGDTKEDFRYAIVSLLSNEMKKKNLSKNARILAENQFNNSKITDELIKFYKKLIE